MGDDWSRNRVTVTGHRVVNKLELVPPPAASQQRALQRPMGEGVPWRDSRSLRDTLAPRSRDNSSSGRPGPSATLGMRRPASRDLSSLALQDDDAVAESWPQQQCGEVVQATCEAQQATSQPAGSAASPELRASLGAVKPMWPMGWIPPAALRMATWDYSDASDQAPARSSEASVAGDCSVRSSGVMPQGASAWPVSLCACPPLRHKFVSCLDAASCLAPVPAPAHRYGSRI